MNEFNKLLENHASNKFQLKCIYSKIFDNFKEETFFIKG